MRKKKWKDVKDRQTEALTGRQSFHRIILSTNTNPCSHTYSLSPTFQFPSFSWQAVSTDHFCKFDRKLVKMHMEEPLQRCYHGPYKCHESVQNIKTKRPLATSLTHNLMRQNRCTKLKTPHSQLFTGDLLFFHEQERINL